MCVCAPESMWESEDSNLKESGLSFTPLALSFCLHLLSHLLSHDENLAERETMLMELRLEIWLAAWMTCYACCSFTQTITFIVVKRSESSTRVPFREHPLESFSPSLHCGKSLKSDQQAQGTLQKRGRRDVGAVEWGGCCGMAAAPINLQ